MSERRQCAEGKKERKEPLHFATAVSVQTRLALVRVVPVSVPVKVGQVMLTVVVGVGAGGRAGTVFFVPFDKVTV